MPEARQERRERATNAGSAPESCPEMAQEGRLACLGAAQRLPRKAVMVLRSCPDTAQGPPKLLKAARKAATKT